MRKYLLIMACICFGSLSFASKIDTTIFHTEFEKNLFLYHLNDPKVSNIDWFFALDYENEYRVFAGKYHQFAEWMAKETESYPTLKKLKNITKNTQSSYLKKYQDQCFFGDIFTSGNYNSITASALYSLLLSDLKIPCVIKERGNQVVVVADPYQTNFTMETTPGKEMMNYAPKFISDFVEFLHSRSIITDAEVKKETTSDLFAMHYLAEKTISLKQLAGILYFNKGILLYNKTDYAEALKYFEKAELLYPANYVLYMKNNAALNILNENHQKKIFDGKILAKYLLSNGYSSKSMAICYDYFGDATNELILNHPNIQKYDQYFADFKLYADTFAVHDIDRTYYYYKGYYLTTRNDFSSALQCLAKAYLANPENIQTQQFVKEIVYKGIENERNDLEGPEIITKQFQSFPFLLKEKIFQQMYVYTYSTRIEDAYKENNLLGMVEFYNKMESALKTKDGLIVDEEIVVTAYNLLATFFYNFGNDAEALRSLERGLIVLPNSDKLKKRHQSMLEYKNGKKKYPEQAKTNSTLKKKITIKEAQAYAKSHSDSINRSVTKFLKGKWKLKLAVNTNGKHVSTKEEGTTMTFNDNDKLVFQESSKVQSVGTWKYDKVTCKLTIKNSTDKSTINIVLQKMTETQLRGVLYAENTDGEAVEIFLSKVAGN